MLFKLKFIVDSKLKFYDQLYSIIENKLLQFKLKFYYETQFSQIQHSQTCCQHLDIQIKITNKICSIKIKISVNQD